VAGVGGFPAWVLAGGKFGRRSLETIMRSFGAGKDTTPSAFLLARASGAEAKGRQ